MADRIFAKCLAVALAKDTDCPEKSVTFMPTAETLVHRRGEFTNGREKGKMGVESNVEAVAELSTRLILHACDFIVKKLRGS